MGIKGLESYIEKELPFVLESVDIIALAKEYAHRKEQDPVLYIMASSFLRVLAKKQYHDICHMHMVEKFALHIQDLVKVYSEHNIHCVLLFGKTTCDRKEDWIPKNKKFTEEYSRILRSLESERPEDAYYDLTRIAPDKELIKFKLRGAKCEIRQISDSGVIQLLSNSEYFGVLAQDSDYVIMEGVKHYFSIKYLSESGLCTKEYRRQKLASSLGIEERLLPLLGSLCGNCEIFSEDLREFHLFLLRNHRNFHYIKTLESLPGKLLIPRVAGWIGRHSHKFRDSALISKRVSELLNSPGLEEDFSRSLCLYGVRGAQSELSLPEEITDDWSQILHLASEGQRNKGVHCAVWSVIKYAKHHARHPRETLSDINYPNQSVVMEELLRRVYGVLLKERPRSLETPSVKLYHHKTNDPTPTEIVPIYPSDHPGLKYLWGICSIEEKQSLLWWVITGKSDQSSMTSLMSIPGELRISTLAIFFLENLAEYKLLRWHIEALIGQVVCLFLGNDLTQYELSPMTVLEWDVSTVYLSACNSIVMADDACGSPLFGKSFVFDGVLFNKLFNLMKNGFTDPEVCNTHHFKTILGFIYPS